MTTDRISVFRDMLTKQPDNAMVRFGLANELLKLQRFDEAANELAQYLERHDDEGNGWLRYAESLRECDRIDDAKKAIARGIDAANRYAHSGLVNELQSLSEELDDL